MGQIGNIFTDFTLEKSFPYLRILTFYEKYSKKYDYFQNTPQLIITLISFLELSLKNTNKVTLNETLISIILNKLSFILPTNKNNLYLTPVEKYNRYESLWSIIIILNQKVSHHNFSKSRLKYLETCKYILDFKPMKNMNSTLKSKSLKLNYKKLTQVIYSLTPESWSVISLRQASVYLTNICSST